MNGGENSTFATSNGNAHHHGRNYEMDDSLNIPVLVPQELQKPVQEEDLMQHNDHVRVAASPSSVKLLDASGTSGDTGSTRIQQLQLPDPMNATLQGTSGTFRQFVRSWNDDIGKKGSSYTPSVMAQHHPSWIPPHLTLRHSISTPAMGDDSIPPPIPLDPFQRSTTTPSAFTDWSSTPSDSLDGNNSCTFFALPSQQFMNKDTFQHENRSSPHAFGPIQFYSMALMEHTDIEVQQQQQPQTSNKTNCHKRSARKFLSNVRVLRRRKTNPSTITTNNDVIIMVNGAETTTSGDECSMEGSVDSCAQNVIKKTYVDPMAGRINNEERSIPTTGPLESDCGGVSPAAILPSHGIFHSHHSPQSSRLDFLSAAFATLTTLSETDREVMELNKKSHHHNNTRPHQQFLPTESTTLDVSSSQSIQSTTTDGTSTGEAVLLRSTIPNSPREGASLPPNRFFVDQTTLSTPTSTTGSSSSSSSSNNGNSALDGLRLLPPTRFVVLDADYYDSCGTHVPLLHDRLEGLEEEREESPSTTVFMDESPSSASEIVFARQFQRHDLLLATRDSGELAESVEVQRLTPTKGPLTLRSLDNQRR